MYVARLGGCGCEGGAPALAALAHAPRRRLGALGQDIVAFDPALPYTDRYAIPGAPAGGYVLNQGCPPNYFAQLVGAGEPGAVGPITIAGVVNRGYVRCRLSATTTPRTIMDETGVTWTEAMNVYTQAVRDTASQVGEAARKALDWTPWIAGGVVAVLGLVLLLRVVPSR